MRGIRLTTSLARTTSALALTTCLVAPTAALAQPAPSSPDQSSTETAQQKAADDQDIVVTGIRASLERAMDLKRDAQGVVDAVSAEDIGKFPDTNLAESLQRIPGVSIDRRNGEGSLVTVRGFGPTFNLVTLNGRQMAISDVQAVGGDQNVDFSRATSRSFDFSNLASEGVSRLEVYKTGRAAIPSGGIGASINVVTQRPLDGHATGLRASIGAKALYDTSLDSFKVSPEASGIVSWSNPEDSVGISIFGSYQKREAAAASATSNDWNITTFANMPGRGPNTVITNAPTNPSQLVAIPNDSRYHYSRSSRERINGQATLQFRPIESLTITADGLYAQNKIDEERSDQTNWFNRPFDHVTFDGDPIVASATFLDEGSGYTVKDLGFEQQYRATKTTLYSAGLNLNWEVADGLTLNLDGNHSKSKSVPNSRNGASSTLVSFGAPVVDAHSVDYSGPIPIQHFTVNDRVAGNNNGVLDIGDLGTQVQRTNASRQEQRVNQLRADLGWDFGGGGRFDLGATYTDANMTSARVQTQQTLGDWGITRVGDVQQLAGSLVEQYCLGCKFDHYKPGDSGIAFRGNAVDLYEAFAQAYKARGNPINVTGNDFDQVHEKVLAGYVQFTWNGELMGRKANLTAGARYENTKVISNSLVAQPDYIKWDSDNDFTRVIGNQVASIRLKGEYNNLLPSIDFRLEPMDNVVARVSYSKTLGRADYGNLFASQSANGPNRPTALQGRATGTSGNPGLKPLVSDNFDVSLEWYFSRSSYVSAGFFAKKVKNFIGLGQFEQNLFGLRDPSSGAAGTRSGTALAQLNTLGVTVSDVSLFTLTALLIENNGNLANATQQFLANYSNGQLNQQFVDAVLARVDVIPNASDPLFNFSVATPINNKQANIYGFELQGQYFLGDTGFGISGSFTKVNGDVGFNRGADPSQNQFALVGLSDSFNITGIYDKNGISARFAYNWRGNFLNEINRGASRNPGIIGPFGTLDVNLSYDVTRNLSVTLEAVNVLSEPIRTYARAKTELLFAQELKPRVLLGARFKF
jgi:TonB-dependent receptor